MHQPEGLKGVGLELHRIEEETGFKPNQLVVNKITKMRGRVKGYLKEGNNWLIGVDVSGMRDYVLDTTDKWEKILDN